MISPEIVNNAVTVLQNYQGKWGSFSPSAAPKLEYHVFADAVFWSDELPRPIPTDLEDSFRFVINHRTSILLGETGQFPEVWNAAKECYPDWPGFLPYRCTANAEIAERIKRIRRVSAWRIQRAFADDPTELSPDT
jgi:hypothetical protein